MAIEKGISQAALADYLDISHGFMEMLKIPDAEPSININHINSIAKILECSIYDFLPEHPL